MSLLTQSLSSADAVKGERNDVSYFGAETQASGRGGENCLDLRALMKRNIGH